MVPIANDPFNHTITNFYPEPPSYGGLNQDKPPKIPLMLDFRRRGDLLNLFSHINLFYPNALQPDKWPRESSGPFNQVTETFLYFIDWNEMQDSSITSVEYDGVWSRVTPWLPWMLMGPTPGHCQYQTFIGGGGFARQASQSGNRRICTAKLSEVSRSTRRVGGTFAVLARVVFA